MRSRTALAWRTKIFGVRRSLLSSTRSDDGAEKEETWVPWVQRNWAVILVGHLLYHQGAKSLEFPRTAARSPLGLCTVGLATKSDQTLEWRRQDDSGYLLTCEEGNKQEDSFRHNLTQNKANPQRATAAKQLGIQTRDQFPVMPLKSFDKRRCYGNVLYSRQLCRMERYPVTDTRARRQNSDCDSL